MSRKKNRSKVRKAEPTTAPAEGEPAAGESLLRRWAGPGSLVIMLALVYGSGLHPGLAEGDAAELQWVGPLLGICHSPGYAIQVTALKIFTSLPLGSSEAWRANLFSLLMGILGSLALYGAVRRITGKAMAGWIAAALLALGSVWWSHSLIAEVYVFGGTLIAFALYAFVRFPETNQAVWMYVASFSMGMAAAERPSELLVAPALAAAWFAARGKCRLDWRRATAAGIAFLIPFALVITLTLTRDDPSRLATRDDAIRNEIPGMDLSGEVTIDYETDRSLGPRIRNAVVHMLGLKWRPRLGTGSIPGNLTKYGWVVSGLGVWGPRYAPAGQHDPMLTGGFSLGLPGLALAALGIFLWRKHIHWVLFAGLLVAGNLLFVLPYVAFDAMTFIIPSLIGLSLLAGLGCAPPGPAGRKKAAAFARFRIGLLLLPLILIAVNHQYVDRSTDRTTAQIRLRDEFTRLDFPSDSVILTTYWPAMTMRYLLRLAVDRPDVAVIHLDQKNVARARDYFAKRNRPVFATTNAINPAVQQRALPRTPREFLRHSLFRLGSAP